MFPLYYYDALDEMEEILNANEAVQLTHAVQAASREAGPYTFHSVSERLAVVASDQGPACVLELDQRRVTWLGEHPELSAHLDPLGWARLEAGGKILSAAAARAVRS